MYACVMSCTAAWHYGQMDFGYPTHLRTYNIRDTTSSQDIQRGPTVPVVQTHDLLLPRPHSSGFLAPFLKVRPTGSSSTFGNSPCTAPGDLAEAVLASLILVKS